MRSGMGESKLKEKMGTIRALVQLSLPYKKRFILIALLAFLGTGADLLQPLIYRVAINDVAGPFFGHPPRRPPQHEPPPAHPPPHPPHPTPHPPTPQPPPPPPPP